MYDSRSDCFFLVIEKQKNSNYFIKRIEVNDMYLKMHSKCDVSDGSLVLEQLQKIVKFLKFDLEIKCKRHGRSYYHGFEPLVGFQTHASMTL